MTQVQLSESTWSWKFTDARLVHSRQTHAQDPGTNQRLRRERKKRPVMRWLITYPGGITGDICWSSGGSARFPKSRFARASAGRQQLLPSFYA
jgi:hypothetical protein